ncbi:hypothetical protein PHYSODRAFT_340477 [Phytophthora sojae]|uniref:Uncharacterized protein n=1 Tax=Phytophthora sojae (strain P6497) TaxID=1094619 RepID=G5A9U4_PHYSP|nr:hypothetical protein PHYSODRAFT_340477 [Phytophthora sojae]EGZ07374.1 hypothetical protein PHYSODRAFT_340477 [Phytophthora sojae]|eukprot:XP_009536940.1 hypothetical protein PHYSODRAFT_340477 [Phytophthora sojae]
MALLVSASYALQDVVACTSQDLSSLKGSALLVVEVLHQTQTRKFMAEKVYKLVWDADTEQLNAEEETFVDNMACYVTSSTEKTYCTTVICLTRSTPSACNRKERYDCSTSTYSFSCKVASEVENLLVVPTDDEATTVDPAKTESEIQGGGAHVSKGTASVLRQLNKNADPTVAPRQIR